MQRRFKGWKAVAADLLAVTDEAWLNDGQRLSLKAIASRLPKNGLVLADEVGMGKTRIAVAIAKSVVANGGRVVILAPPGLGYQWHEELRQGGMPLPPPILRSLWGYLGAWQPDASTNPVPWFDQDVVLISQMFANWRMGGAGNVHLRTLLPAVYGTWKKQQGSERYPNGFRDRAADFHPYVLQAAKSLVGKIVGPDGRISQSIMEELEAEAPWADAFDGHHYGHNGRLRPWLERVVGLGLGVFDLVIIDEAHKSRGELSGLSRLLERVIVQSVNARRFAMTATPVELDAWQWGQTLARIGLDENTLSPIKAAIQTYGEATRRLRQTWRSNEDARETYKKAAFDFQVALGPYLLRRDKREDDDVQRFTDQIGGRPDTYRQETEISIKTASLSLTWRKAVCAAESLSIVTRQLDDPIAKRLRLTLGNGHGVASLIDQLQRGAEEDVPPLDDVVDVSERAAPMDHTQDTVGDAGLRRAARAQWWRGVAEQAFSSETGGLFHHPAILAAVEAIESYSSAREKVLVFGRFTRPMRALVDLLNAREMLKSLSEGRSWPQAGVHRGGEHDEWPAIVAAHQQIKCQIPLEEVEDRLKSNYGQLEYRRERLRENIFEWVEQGLGPDQKLMRKLLLAAKESKAVDSRSLLARALGELLDERLDPSQLDCAKAFADLVSALGDRDAVDNNVEVDFVTEDENKKWRAIEEQLREEYGSQRGRFARLMFGETRHETRRMLQLAFNREGSFPRVLVAQSVVGREGLNLHRACRVVVLLHPEWNPGVVEQQIGRVDRVGSHWAKKLADAVEQGTDADKLPRIEIRPVVFKGTYDEHHWKVLRERWDDLRAQLHGIVVPHRLHDSTDIVGMQLISELNAAAPNFSSTIRAQP